MLSSLLPISEKGEEEAQFVPSYDQVSDRSSFYEKVNGPNPVYQQYNRKGVGGIPITMMEPKRNVETVENALYDDNVGVTDLEDEPVIVDTTKLSATNVANDITPIHAIPKNKSKISTTSAFSHKYEDADVMTELSEELKMEDASKHKSSHDMSIFVSKSHT